MSWVDDVLEDWGAWRRGLGDAQGWGGALELDRLLCGARDPNAHSDPVCAEWAATAYGEEAGRRAVDHYVQLCSPELRLTAHLRYVGVWLPVEGDWEYKDRVREIALEGCPRMGMEVYFRDTRLTTAQIAEAMLVAPETVLERLRAVSDRVRRELSSAARNRKRDARSGKKYRAARLNAA